MSAANLAAALVEFQSKIPVITKNKTAKIPTKAGNSYSYNYADLSDIWDAIRAPLKECGLAVTQALVEGGLNTTIWHVSGESYGASTTFDTSRCSPQEAGSAITYFRRYALTSMLGISTEEDDDGKAGGTKTAPRKAVAAQTDLAKAKDSLRAAMAKAKLSKDQMKDYEWVATATEADIDRINGVAEALSLGKAVQTA